MEITNRINGYVSGSEIGMTGAAAGKSSLEAAGAKKVAKEFETMFVGMMLKSMRETVGKEKLTNGGHGEEMYRSMLDQEYAKAVTERGGVGLSAMLERRLAAPLIEETRNQGIPSHDITTKSTKTEVTYENR